MLRNSTCELSTGAEGRLYVPLGIPLYFEVHDSRIRSHLPGTPIAASPAKTPGSLPRQAGVPPEHVEGSIPALLADRKPFRSFFRAIAYSRWQQFKANVRANANALQDR